MTAALPQCLLGSACSIITSSRRMRSVLLDGPHRQEGNPAFGIDMGEIGATNLLPVGTRQVGQARLFNTRKDDVMRRKAITPTTIHPPLGSYNHGVLVDGPPATLLMAGQVGMAADGHVPDSVEGQTELVFANIQAILETAGLERRHVVKLTTYLTDPAYRQLYMPIRNAWIEEPWPASTLVAVKALADPRFLIEIEAIAIGEV